MADLVRDDEVLTSSELSDVLGERPRGDSVPTHSGDWRRESPDSWRFFWYDGCGPDEEN